MDRVERLGQAPRGVGDEAATALRACRRGQKRARASEGAVVLLATRSRRRADAPFETPEAGPAPRFRREIGARTARPPG
jgi:hypothetical protein